MAWYDNIDDLSKSISDASSKLSDQSGQFLTDMSNALGDDTKKGLETAALVIAAAVGIPAIAGSKAVTTIASGLSKVGAGTLAGLKGLTGKNVVGWLGKNASWLVPTVAKLTEGSGGDSTVKQEPLQTAEQKEAQQLLLDYAKTGGEQYTGPTGNYELTANEKLAQNKLSSLLSTGLGPDYALATDEYRKLLTTDKYDPYSEKGVYKGFKRNVEKEYEQSINDLKNSMAYSGNLYSTNIGQQAEKLGEAGTNKLSDMLAGLYQDFGKQKLAGASNLGNMATTAYGTELTGIAAGEQIGSIPRTIANQEAQDKWTQWYNNEGKKLAALTSVSGSTVPWSVKELPTAKSDDTAFWNLMGTIAGNVWGNKETKTAGV